MACVDPNPTGGRGYLKRSLVAGGAGLLGSHLCRRLLAEGHRVLCMDNFVSSSERNVHELLGNPRFELKHHDVVEPFGELGELEFVFHLASPASPARFLDLAEEIARVNSLGTWNLLEVARNSHARFLLASTSEVYGNPEVHPQPETYWGNVNTVGERSCYDESKRFAETLTYIAGRKHGQSTRIVRIFNTYGPRMLSKDGRAVVEFIVRALEGKPLIVHGDGSQTRSWCYVDDMVEGMYRAMTYDSAEGRVINLGNPAEMSILEVAEMIVSLTGARSEIRFAALPENDPMRRCPDISLARELLDWQPRVALEDGLARTIEWHRAELGS